MKVLRMLGIVLMCLWIFNGVGHVVTGLMGQQPTAWHLFGGITQVALAWWLLLKIHAWQPGIKAAPEAKTNGPS